MRKIVEELAEDVDLLDKVHPKPGESYIIYNDETAKIMQQ